MKKLLFLFTLSLLLVSMAWGQTTVFSDDFSTNQNASWTTSGQIGSSAWTVSRSGVDWGARRNTSPAQLELTNDASASTNANGWVFANVATSGFSSPYNATLSSNTGLVTWSFNIRQIRSDPAGFGSGNYGAAFILATTNQTANSNGTGYAIVYGQSGSTDPIRLAKFSGGLSTGLTNIVTSNTSGLTDFGAQYISCKVTYNPSNNQWELFLRNDGSSEFADPLSGTLVSQGTATDNTYTSTSLEYMGGYWQGSTGGDQTAFFDNVLVSISAGGTPTAATPTFDPNGGDFINSVDVELSSETDDATIYYTTDGTDPDDTSSEYIDPINLTATTTIKAIAYATGFDPSAVAEATFTKLEPATTTIPYTESFTSNLNGVYTYTVSGTKPWNHSNGAAVCNGYQGSGNEEHWMVLPGINFDNYTAERMTFSTTANYGTINESNYLKLYYSTDYAGLGDPTTANWTELSFVNGGTNNQSTPSGVINLAGISGTQVFLAFKYVSTDNPTMWTVDDISIYIASPVVTVNASLNSFSYEHNAGPSEEQSFTVSGADLTSDIGITAPTNYEISTGTDATFVATSPITLTQADGSVAETTIYVRLKDNLAIGTYNQDISIVSDGATSQTVSCSGEVTTPAAPVTPVATAASVVGSDSFTANWGTVSGASGYYLDVYTKDSCEYATDLFISEYVEGSGTGNKYIEIFNGTGTIVELSDYSLYLYSNGAGSPSQSVALSGSLADGATYVIGRTDGTIYTLSNLTSNTVINFNGNDAIALYNTSTELFVDIFGRIGDDPGSAWTGDGGYTTLDRTLVRKADVTQGVTVNPVGTGPTAFTTLTTEWDMFDQNTATYLGSHTFDGGTTLTYVTGYQNLDVGNFTNYEITGLDPETTYYYIVRAYDGYSQTSLNSNEIEVTTIAAITYDITPDTPATYGNEGAETSITISGGGFVGANIITEGLTPAANAAFITSSAGILQLIGTGSVTLSFTPAAGDTWFTYSISGGDWVVIDLTHSETVIPIEIIVNLGSKDAAFEFKSGTGGDPTLPVELSTFTVALNNYNNAVLTWVTQTETGVSGFYVFRNTEESLATAEMVSNLIPATNTSQQQVYLFTDKELGGPGTYYYWLQVSDMDGSDSFYGPITLVYQGGNEPGIPSIPQVTELKSIYPNPFNPSTTISYGLAEAADVKVQIFNSRGQLVRSISEGQRNAGNYNLIWNGTDNNGQSQPTGVYFVRLHAGKKVFNSKAVLMK